jgi:ankyrin repeat protein
MVFRINMLTSACKHNDTELALSIIQTIMDDPSNSVKIYLKKTDKFGITPLIYACAKNMELVAITLINTTYSDPSYISKHGTALTFACFNKLNDVAMLLITNQQVINSISSVDKTNTTRVSLLSLACINKLESVALAIIATEQTNIAMPDHKNRTALICACYSNMEEIALMLIDSGNSNPSIIFNERNGLTGTALILACKNKMVDTALALIASGKSNLNYTPKSGQNAMYWAKHHNLDNIINILNIRQNEPIRINDFIPLYENENENLFISPNLL